MPSRPSRPSIRRADHRAGRALQAYADHDAATAAIDTRAIVVAAATEPEAPEALKYLLLILCTIAVVASESIPRAEEFRGGLHCIVRLKAALISAIQSSKRCCISK